MPAVDFTSICAVGFVLLVTAIAGIWLEVRRSKLAADVATWTIAKERADGFAEQLPVPRSPG